MGMWSILLVPDRKQEAGDTSKDGVVATAEKGTQAASMGPPSPFSPQQLPSHRGTTSSKWSRSNGKGMAVVAGDEEMGSSPSQKRGDRVEKKERPQGGAGQHEHHHWPSLHRGYTWELDGRRFPCPGCLAGISPASLILQLLPRMCQNCTDLGFHFG